ncbi:DUF6221 family protein, partial [Streptomyces sp. NPDC057674]|uniref:DUF6221 family protein n=1 Tax=Streptomyces sp. NPDC057674 TaxID=3346203 RepID=UPI0036B0E054
GLGDAQTVGANLPRYVIATMQGTTVLMSAWRMRTEIAAKRRALERHAECGTGIGRCDDGGHATEGTPCADLTDLAAPYADHPDYREEWGV